MLLDHPSDGLAAIRTRFGAIFVSLELSRSTWLVTSLSPGTGEKMSKHRVKAGDIANLLKLFADLKRKAQARTGESYPIITIQEAGLDGFWLHRCLLQEGIEGHVVRSGLDRDVAPAQASQDGQARWRDAVADAFGLQTRRAAGLRDGGRSLSGSRGPPQALPRAEDIDR